MDPCTVIVTYRKITATSVSRRSALRIICSLLFSTDAQREAYNGVVAIALPGANGNEVERGYVTSLHPGCQALTYVSLLFMTLKRRGLHTTLTETARLVVETLSRIPNITLIAPGEIRLAKGQRSGQRYLTIVHTAAGLELITSGQSVQKVTVHTTQSQKVAAALKNSKHLVAFTIKERERRPGV